MKMYYRALKTELTRVSGNRLEFFFATPVPERWVREFHEAWQKQAMPQGATVNRLLMLIPTEDGFILDGSEPEFYDSDSERIRKVVAKVDDEWNAHNASRPLQMTAIKSQFGSKSK